MTSYAIAVSDKQPDQFIKIEQSIPTPGDNELLVAVKAIAMNPVDTKVRAGIQKNNTLTAPRILGWDASGEVLSMGKNVKGFNIGDAVWYAGDITRSGSNTTHQLIDYRIVAHKPQTLNWTEAAAMPLTSITAWEGLFEKLKIQDGEPTNTLLIIGGAGGVGSVAIPLAALKSKVQIIATASRPESVQWCLDRGANMVVDYHDLKTNLEKKGIKHVDYIFCLNDTEQHWQAMSEVIAPFGQICSIVENVNPLDMLKIRSKSTTFHWELMFTKSMYQTPDMNEQGRLLQQVADLVDEGKLQHTLSHVLQGLTVENIEKAHQMQLEGHTNGKIAIEV